MKRFAVVAVGVLLALSLAAQDIETINVDLKTAANDYKGKMALIWGGMGALGVGTIIILANMTSDNGHMDETKATTGLVIASIGTLISLFVEPSATTALYKMQRYEYLATHYGSVPPNLVGVICAGNVVIGMTEGQARAAMGPPERVNTTRGSFGIHDQWVYKYGTYLYFENGILETIRN